MRRPPISLRPPTHVKRTVTPDADFEPGLAAHLRSTMTRKSMLELWANFVDGTRDFDALMRRAIVRALAVRIGNGVHLEPGVAFLHAETFEIGDGTFIGAKASLHGRSDGTCRIGARVWIGPQVYLDARNLIIEDEVGIGAGVRILGSAHTGLPLEVPLLAADLEAEAVRIEHGAELGAGAVVLPGVTIGHGSVVGAGAVVTENVPPLAVVAGVPATVARYRRRPRQRTPKAGGSSAR